VALVAALALIGCAHQTPSMAGAPASSPGGAPSGEPVRNVRPRDQIVPLVDAHQHSMSPMAQAVVVLHPELPPVALPPELDPLLRAREKVSGAPPVGDVFAEDAIILQFQEGRWWKGHERINRFMNNWPPGIRLIPRAYAVDGSAGYIAGGVRLGASETDNLNFLLGIRKRADGRWQIASEMMRDVEPPEYDRPITGDALVELLDDSGIRYGVVLSVAYWFGSPLRDPPVKDPAGKTREENDWTIAQTAKHPDRLIPFCSVNPLADYAIAELERCASVPRVKGMKLHFANSRVDLGNAEHLEKLKRFFRVANEKRLALVVHQRTRGEYTAAQGQLLLDIFSQAPDVPVQIAHMGNTWGMAEFFADAIAAGDPRTKHLYFDLTHAVPTDKAALTPAFLASTAATLRKIGLSRVFYGSDMNVGKNPPPREHWHAIRQLPLTDEELRVIANNVPPYIPR
jgi:predicted TIM-barrel fold metal-dependent hydrolase